jgi:membrane protease YdiL (CAAX protease family)
LTTSRDLATLVFGVGFAFLLWYIVFLTDLLGSFWLRITLAAVVLTLYAVFFGGIDPRVGLDLGSHSLINGVISGCLLYAVFYVGFNVFRPFVEQGVISVYSIRGDSQPYLAASVLMGTGICEEFFWRRYVQGSLVARLGKKGVILSTLAYASIHLPTLNPPLMFAAFIAGLYWGVLYEYTGSFGSVAVSHIVWTELIFVFLPFR